MGVQIKNNNFNLVLQGVVHRDVKPGNFLFSSKTSKGYLIDFNLATVSNALLSFDLTRGGNFNSIV